MSGFYKNILKHSTVYAAGQVLSRIVSVVMLPVYTRSLSDVEYGCIAILDLTGSVFIIVLGSVMAEAVARHHFDAKTPSEEREVWWTGSLYVLGVSSLALGAAWLLRGPLAAGVLADAVSPENGRYYFGLLGLSLFFAINGLVPSARLRVCKRSGLFVGVSLLHLVLSVGCIVYFLVYRGLGIEGVLLGNIIANGAQSIILNALALRGLLPVSFSPALIRKLYAFSGPLIAATLLSLVMHQADRFFLRFYLGMGDVGVYSLAYAIGQGLNTLVLLPFISIWNIVVYEIADQPNSREVYGKVFEYFLLGLMLLMYGVSLFARPILDVIATPEYAGAATIIPVVCLAYVFFSASSFFNIPARIAKKTGRLTLGPIAGSCVNVAANTALIPLLGPAGAAWASVLTFAVFSLMNFIVCRRIEKIPYPSLRLGGVLLALSAAYAVHEFLIGGEASPIVVHGFATCAWLAFAGAVAWRLVREYRAGMLAAITPMGRSVEGSVQVAE